MLFRATCLDRKAGFSCVFPFWKANDFVASILRTLRSKTRPDGDAMGGALEVE